MTYSLVFETDLESDDLRAFTELNALVQDDISVAVIVNEGQGDRMKARCHSIEKMVQKWKAEFGIAHFDGMRVDVIPGEPTAGKTRNMTAEEESEAHEKDYSKLVPWLDRLLKETPADQPLLWITTSKPTTFLQHEQRLFQHDNPLPVRHVFSGGACNGGFKTKENERITALFNRLGKAKSISRTQIEPAYFMAGTTELAPEIYPLMYANLDDDLQAQIRSWNSQQGMGEIVFEHNLSTEVKSEFHRAQIEVFKIIWQYTQQYPETFLDLKRRVELLGDPKNLLENSDPNGSAFNDWFECAKQVLSDKRDVTIKHACGDLGWIVMNMASEVNFFLCKNPENTTAQDFVSKNGGTEQLALDTFDAARQPDAKTRSLQLSKVLPLFMQGAPLQSHGEKLAKITSGLLVGPSQVHCRMPCAKAQTVLTGLDMLSDTKNSRPTHPVVLREMEVGSGVIPVSCSSSLLTAELKDNQYPVALRLPEATAEALAAKSSSSQFLSAERFINMMSANAHFLNELKEVQVTPEVKGWTWKKLLDWFREKITALFKKIFHDASSQKDTSINKPQTIEDLAQFRVAVEQEKDQMAVSLMVPRGIAAVQRLDHAYQSIRDEAKYSKEFKKMQLGFAKKALAQRKKELKAVLQRADVVGRAYFEAELGAMKATQIKQDFKKQKSKIQPPQKSDCACFRPLVRLFQSAWYQSSRSQHSTMKTGYTYQPLPTIESDLEGDTVVVSKSKDNIFSKCFKRRSTSKGG